MRPGRVLPAPAVLAVLLVLGQSATNAAPTYVSTAACAICHAEQLEQWRGSHHDRAMEELGEGTVLGDFGDTSFAHDGVTSRFFRRNGKYFVNTPGADGKARDFEVKYTFGFDPLQQYLLDVGGGRLQAFTVAWDSRPRQAGGQRWFDLQTEETVGSAETIDSNHPLHWSGSFYNWAARCAPCHSTDLRKNFDLATRTYRTTWSDIDVGCEACHGPGSAHVAWANKAPEERKRDTAYGLADLGTARAEIDTCAPCHSRREALTEAAPAGTPFLDAHVPELLREDLYFADGQILDEVYEYGSFTQSKMHDAGVRCTDCHEPHSLSLRIAGNGICTQCHNPGGNARFPTLRSKLYDDPSHHHHAPESAAAQCVACHMPSRTYMVLDDRRDHSLRIPRPDLSAAHGVPNACNGCHTEQTPQWAAGAIETWFGAARAPHWTGAIAAGRAGRPAAVASLARLAAEGGDPAIVRATAVSLLDRLGPSGQTAALQGLRDSDALVRIAAARSLESLPPTARRIGVPLLSDPVRAVRIEAARPLAALPRGELGAAEVSALDAALGEYRAAQNVNLDTPEAHHNLALLHIALGDADAARQSYETAIAIGPYFIPAYVNLADLYRATGREPEAEQALRRALAVDADNADALHSLGLALVRQRKTDEAMTILRRAAELAPGTARYAYTYGVALHSTGKPREALDTLHAAHSRHPADIDITAALVSFHRERGDREDALQYARELAALVPGDPEVAQLVATLEQEAKQR